MKNEERRERKEVRRKKEEERRKREGTRRKSSTYDAAGLQGGPMIHANPPSRGMARVARSHKLLLRFGPSLLVPVLVEGRRGSLVRLPFS